MAATIARRVTVVSALIKYRKNLNFTDIVLVLYATILLDYILKPIEYQEFHVSRFPKVFSIFRTLLVF